MRVALFILLLIPAMAVGARETLTRFWAGIGLHHRSAIYETAQQFGRIKGGSNVQTFYLQYEY